MQILSQKNEKKVGDVRFVPQTIAMRRYGYKDYRALRRLAMSGQIKYRVFVTPKGYEKWQFEV